MDNSKKQMVKGIVQTLKWSMNELSDYKMKICLYIIMIIVKTLFELYITSYTGSIVDLAMSDNMKVLLYNGIYFFCLYLINAVISLVCNRFSASNYIHMTRTLMLKIYRKILNSSWEELTDFHSGDLITRLNNDVMSVAGNTSGLVPTFISEFVVIAGAVLMIIFMDYTMLIVAIVVGPIVLITSRIFMNKIYNAQMKIREADSKINAYNKETFNNIQAVKAFGLGDKFYEKMDALEVNRVKCDLNSNKYSLMSWATTYIVTIFAGMICIGWTFYRVHNGAITYGNLTVLILLAMRIGDSLKGLLTKVPNMMEYMAASDRLKGLLNLTNEDDSVDDSLIENVLSESKETGITVSVDNMSFAYKNGHQVFDGVSMEANPGEIIAVVGPSGEGKTTLIRIILGIIKAQSGKVWAKYSSNDSHLSFGKKTRQLISYVPQGNTMIMGTIEENMKMMNPDATEDDIIEALKMACAYDFVSSLPDGIHHMIGENGLGFSEGQNQRLSIARALIRKTPILLMDEATSALDVVTEREVLRNIMHKDAKRTVILTTHRPSVLSMCDRVYRIAKKQISIVDEAGVKQLMDDF